MSQFPETTPAVLSVSASPFQQEVCQPCLLLLVVCQLGSLMVPKSPIQPCHRCQLQWLCFTSHHHPSPCQPLSPRPSDWEWRGGNRWWSGSRDTLEKISFHPATASFWQDGSLRLFLYSSTLLLLFFWAPNWELGKYPNNPQTIWSLALWNHLLRGPRILKSRAQLQKSSLDGLILTFMQTLPASREFVWLWQGTGLKDICLSS